MIEWLKKLLFRSEVVKLRELEIELNAKIRTTKDVYTTVRSFRGIDNVEYYGWICNLLSNEEFRFFLFDLRENTIRAMSSMNEHDKIIRCMGMLDMLNMMNEYLTTWKREYEENIRSNNERRISGDE